MKRTFWSPAAAIGPPIAVVPFGWQGGSVLPDDMADIIGNDLRNSGYYSPIPRRT
jgi:TolB protein